MGKFLYSVGADIKKNFLFSLVIAIEILALIIVCGYVLQNVDKKSDILDSYDKKYDNAIVFQDSRLLDKLKLYDLKEEDIGCSMDKTTTIGENVTIISKLAADILSIKHSGKWFSNDYQPDYIEAIVSPELKKIYEMDEKYRITFNDGDSKLIKIIGYLDKDNLAINISSLTYESLFGYTQLLLMDHIPLEKPDTIILNTSYDTQYFIDNYNLNGVTLKELYSDYYNINYTAMYFGNYWIAIIIALVVVGIICNSLYRTESAIRRNTVKYIVGQSRLWIILSEITKSLLLFIIPFLIDTVMVAIFHLSLKKNELPFITWEYFGYSTAIVITIYILSTFISIFRIIKANPLKEIRK